MNVSFNVSTPTLTPPNTGGVDQSQNVNRQDKSLTITITNGLNGVGGPGGPEAITLSYPLIGPEDIALNEFLQQLQNMDLTQLAGMTMTSAILMLNQEIGNIASAITNGGLGFIEANANELTQLFGKIENQFQQAETQLYDLIENSTYPNFTDFLRLMLAAGQELRKLAAEAKHHMVLAEYGAVMDQAKQMFTAADKHYKATMKNIEADNMEAIAGIVMGAVSLGLSVGGAFFGASKLTGPGVSRSAGAMQGVTGAGSFMTGLNGIVENSVKIAANEKRKEGAELERQAKEAEAIGKHFEAAQKLMQEAQSICQEMADIAKTLEDFVLKLCQDFASNQSQIVQRSNI